MVSGGIGHASEEGSDYGLAERNLYPKIAAEVCRHALVIEDSVTMAIARHRQGTAAFRIALPEQEAPRKHRGGKQRHRRPASICLPTIVSGGPTDDARN